jgi:hypothetical protein
MRNEELNGQAVYRFRRFYRKDFAKKKYRHSLNVIDDQTQEVMATCDVVGSAVFGTVNIVDNEQAIWKMAPNRKIMPTIWSMIDPDQNIVMQFNQKVIGKLVNPLYKTLLVLSDSKDREVYRIVDPRKGAFETVDQLFFGPREWAVIKGEKVVAKLASLPRKKAKSTNGVLGKLKHMLTSSDNVIISVDNQHLLPAPVALGMHLIFKELTDSSGDI